MDIMLERMLSLIPRKEDGKYVHGEKKKFCKKIGAPTNIISEWENGKTKSYRNYVLAVAQAYSVSPKWISGEIDEKMPSVLEDEGLSAVQQEAVDFIKTLSDEQLRRFIAMGKAAFDDRG